jgi:branched-chain amino acid transport system substrate-binding protein
VVAIAIVATLATNATKVLTISSDLPLQRSSFDSNDSTNKAIALYLKQINYKAGKYTVKFKIYDDATASAGSWDPAKCTANAQAHVANKSEVAVMGTYNSGCAKIEIPILNQAPGGAMTMVSDANTNPGLTKSWNPGEPGVYYPTGARNYARAAAAQFAKSIGIRSVYVLNDTQTYGQGVAQAFTTEANKQGLKVLSSGAYGEGWDAKQPDYTALFTKIRALKPDMIYVGGIFDNNGGQLMKDKVAVLGDNTKVKFMAPDGFTGYPAFNSMPEADGAYLSFAGLSSDLLAQIDPTGAGVKFVADYTKEYGKPPVGSYPVYGVAAVQVILAAIANSDGTRKGVTDTIFSGSGISIPATTSVLGKIVNIDPSTGDTSAKDVTIKIVKDGQETTVKAQTVN